VGDPRLEKRIDLGYEHAGKVLIDGNAFLLREMINNLLDNALRYTPAGGRVTARVVALGDFAVLEIEDNGPGISEDESLKVFDRFYRGEGTDSEGSGLGLAIVREIAEVHQGGRQPAAQEPARCARGNRRAVSRSIVFPAHRPPAAGTPGRPFA
jgi:two-component system sensor histidine kinase TctE